MSTRHIIFDIETSPLPDSYLDLIAPEFEAPGNYKDPEAIARNIDQQKAKWKDRAALSPMTGKILCVGFIGTDGIFSYEDGDGDEVMLLNRVRELMENNRTTPFCGWNIYNFDLGFMQKRAWAKNVKACIRAGFDLYRQDQFIDLHYLWNMKQKNEFTSLDSASKFLGLPGKTGSGKDFANLFASDKNAAILYLKRDLELCRDIAERMGIFQ